MTPKEKAKQLVELYCQLLAIRSYEIKDRAKQCALIAVDEILLFLQLQLGYRDYDATDYWQEVKREMCDL